MKLVGLTVREQLMRSIELFTKALDTAKYAPTERERMIAGARLLIRAQCEVTIFTKTEADDARMYLNSMQAR